MATSDDPLADPIVIEVRCNEYTGRDPNPNVPFSAEEIARDAGVASAARAAGREPATPDEVRAFLDPTRS